MPQVDGTRFEAGLLFDELGERFADAGEARVTEGVNGCGAGDLAAAGQLAALGNDDEAVVPAAIVVVLEQRCGVVDIDGLFGHENNIGAPGNSSSIGDPAGIAAHHFDDNDAVMGVGGGADAINGLGGDGDGGVKAKCGVGAVDIVVDGLGYADTGDACVGEGQSDGLRVIAAEGDQRVDLVGLEDFFDLLDTAG